MATAPAAHATRRSRRPRGRSSASPAPGATGPASAVSGATSKPNSSNEYYVVVIDAVEGLDLQADRTSDLCLELAEGGGFLVQEAIHDVLVGQYQQLATGKLSALSHNLPKNLVAHGFGRADEAAPFTAWTRLTHHMFQALAGALTGHLHQPKGREAHDVGLGAIAGEARSRAASTARRCGSSRMSMKSMMMMPPRLRSRSCRAMPTAASRLVRKIVSSRLR